jgi:hypothetical protein
MGGMACLAHWFLWRSSNGVGYYHDSPLVPLSRQERQKCCEHTVLVCLLANFSSRLAFPVARCCAVAILVALQASCVGWSCSVCVMSFSYLQVEYIQWQGKLFKTTLSLLIFAMCRSSPVPSTFTVMAQYLHLHSSFHSTRPAQCGSTPFPTDSFQALRPAVFDVVQTPHTSINL